MSKTHRLNFVVTEKTKSMLESLVERSDSTNMTEVVRRALSLYDQLTRDLSDSNKELVLRERGHDESIKREEILRII